MRMNREQIARLVPHAGAMCVLDAVVDADAQRLHATASSHRDPANPMRAGDRLGAACGIEYAAQAMALHAALQSSGDPAPVDGGRFGMLVSVRDVLAGVARLDSIDAPLEIEVELLAGEAGGALYAFRVSAGDARLLEGRASVIPDAGSRR